ncbi:diguanylate cyclase [Vibrio spartinae]|uniref:diguanylate cyclase n=1 Tax=Vibrio spartinae TaxID=1918945 RepID=A0A1N6M6Z1_9VIBR|nr:diguanylate cyclase [Vibrio spartinae]QMV13941.1 Stalked cell differentiation-controlling protein [Vibrio spartinae]SIO95205.1 Response regulator PleD [Vibrio spartinae]
MLDELEERYNNARVLIIDDDPMNLELLDTCLSETFQTELVQDGREAVKRANDNIPDLILLDIMMEGISGWEICQQMKSSPPLAHIPILFITSHDNDDTQIRCWEAGCADFITKPFNFVTLEHRVKMHMRYKLTTELLTTLSTRDGLTQLSNRRALDNTYPMLKGVCQRNGHPLSLLMIDIDHFKQYNDHYGHLQGDKCLQQVAKILKSTIKRTSDRVFRYGGEEFTALLPNTDREGAQKITVVLLNTISGQHIEHQSAPLGHVTVSIGVTTFDWAKLPQHLDEAIEVADHALYDAKQAGRNCFILTEVKPCHH